MVECTIQSVLLPLCVTNLPAIHKKCPNFIFLHVSHYDPATAPAIKPSYRQGNISSLYFKNLHNKQNSKVQSQSCNYCQIFKHETYILICSGDVQLLMTYCYPCMYSLTQQSNRAPSRYHIYLFTQKQ